MYPPLMYGTLKPYCADGKLRANADSTTRACVEGHYAWPQATKVLFSRRHRTSSERCAALVAPATYVSRPTRATFGTLHRCGWRRLLECGFHYKENIEFTSSFARCVMHDCPRGYTLYHMYCTSTSYECSVELKSPYPLATYH